MKINKIILFGIVAFIFGICSVNANTLNCEYGSRENDDPGTYEKKLTLIYDLKENKSDSFVVVDFSNSPIFSEKRPKFDYKCSSPGYCSYADTYNYSTLYVTKYMPVNGECPKIMHYQGSKSSSDELTGMLYYGDYIYTDDLDDAAPSPDIKTDFDIMLISKDINESGQTDEEIKSENVCVSYSQHMDNIKLTLRENKSCDSNPNFSNAYAELQNICSAYMATYYYTNDNQDVRDCSVACTLLSDDIAELCKDGSNRSYCGSLGNRMVNWLFKILNFIRYGLPPVAIILSILDYMKAIAADNEDEIKKVNGKIVKRLIAVALIFIFPFILNFILGIFDIPGLNASNPFCAK